MRPLLQHASRSLGHVSSSVSSYPARIPSTVRSIHQYTLALKSASICARCQFRTIPTSVRKPTGQARAKSLVTRILQRSFSAARTAAQEKNSVGRSESAPETQRPARVNEDAAPSPIIPPKDETAEGTIARVPAEDLPSHRERQRWDYSKRLSGLMDELLPKIATMTQRVNTFTGTDYSGIEALRREIKEQENLVRTRRLAIDAAKQALDDAHSQQGSSQKEVVALLERKHSWSATDLERYMSLIRSEHLNDQAVREAKDAVLTAENALEEARTWLEKRERAQYHEEQIWSDTIRRNSTWVTFGLMGLNIFLLLASLIAIEPWRRRRLVREIKTTLEAQKAVPTPSPPVLLTQPQPAIPITSSLAAPTIEAEIDSVIEPAGEFLEDIEPMEPVGPAESLLSPEKVSKNVTDVVEETAPAPDAMSNPSAMPDVAADMAVPGAAPLTPEQVDPQTSIDIEEEVKSSAAPETWQEKAIAAAHDLVSERPVSVRKIDYTYAVLQSAAAGAVVSGALVILFRPN
ncbi:Mdm33 family-domain-containing protein [Massariosphaeria phaeospora]|uniref:Sensitive to high expression protein 9, mitochondrial n=1 Tax=Massariosphaeria phaeospora TaxID=100035 RepID=A0A7C8IG40_9PLEO|nr:Mdm33 family-domain-containing protein [Massariosphaeria phaeospora]